MTDSNQVPKVDLSAFRVALCNFAKQQTAKSAGVVTAAYIQRETYSKLDGGDHWVLVGKVVAVGEFGWSRLCFQFGAYSMVFNFIGAISGAPSAATAGFDGERG